MRAKIKTCFALFHRAMLAPRNRRKRLQDDPGEDADLIATLLAMALVLHVSLILWRVFFRIIGGI